MAEGSGGRVSRRRFIGGTAATAGAVVADAYVACAFRAGGTRAGQLEWDVPSPGHDDVPVSAAPLCAIDESHLPPHRPRSPKRATTIGMRRPRLGAPEVRA